MAAAVFDGAIASTAGPRTLVVTRHSGAREWLAARVDFDLVVDHLEPDTVRAGDRVIGTLPIPQIAELQGRDIDVVSLCIALPADKRGRELTAIELEALAPRLVEFKVSEIRSWPA